MTNIELLKSAANAISLDYIECGKLDGSGDLIDRKNCQIWNPLTDDGDALRLAVRLNVHIELHDDLVRVWYANGECVELHFNPGDKQGAARRAIVLAAVEIVKQ